MSGQVLSILVSARLSGLVYKVLIEHEVCTEQRVIILNLSFTCLLSLSLCLSLSISISVYLCFLCFHRTVYFPNFVLLVFTHTLPHNVFFHKICVPYTLSLFLFESLIYFEILLSVLFIVHVTNRL